MIINDKVYFIHIPRTGGRYIKKIFISNFNVKYKKEISPIESMHWHYPLYLKKQKEMNKDSKFFTVIRDPFEKIMSTLKFDISQDKNILNKLKDRDFFINHIEDHRNIHSFHNNWYRPQVDFLSQETFLWHFSLGLGDQFFSWLKNNFGLFIKNKKIPDYDKVPELDYPLVIDSDLTDIKKNTYLYYEKDYLLSKFVLNDLKNKGF